MNNSFSTEALIKKLKTSTFIQHSSMPMGYVPGLPILCVLNDNLCMKVPFLKYMVTGEIDKTFVYPTRFLATVTIPEGQIVSFEDMAFRKAFANVSFSEPVGTFRHEAVKNMDKATYDKLRSALFGEYDKIIDTLIEGEPYSADNEREFKKLFNIVLEPSLRPFYAAIDVDFAKKYITK